LAVVRFRFLSSSFFFGDDAEVDQTELI